MAYPKLNSRSIRLFAATPEELAKKRPNLNAPYFRISRSEIENLLSLTDGDVVMSLGVWKRQGRDGKPDYFTAELTYPETSEAQAKYIARDDEWQKSNPRSAGDAERRRQYAINQRAAESCGVADAEDVPF